MSHPCHNNSKEIGLKCLLLVLITSAPITLISARRRPSQSAAGAPSNDKTGQMSNGVVRKKLENLNNGCWVNMDDLSDPPTFPSLIPDERGQTPAFRQNGTNVFLRPIRGLNRERILKLDNEQVALATCHGKGNKLTRIGTESAWITCLGKQRVSATPITLGAAKLVQSKIQDLKCQKPVSSEVEKVGNCPPPLQTATLMRIGWKVENDFYTQIELCHDQKKVLTHWTKHYILKEINMRDRFPRRPDFSEGQFCQHLSCPQAYYRQRNQKVAIAGILGSQDAVDKYIDPKKDLYLARGHLSPDADFVYQHWQDATYYYGNVAPQWQASNAGNWLQLENSLRNYASKNKVDVIVYTGTFGMLSYPDSRGSKKEIFLSPKDKSLPVPKFFWKVLYDPSTRKGVGFVGVNDPYVEDTRKVKICKDISDDVGFLDSTRNDAQKGLLYSCKVEDLRKVIPYVPELSITGLLTKS